MTARQLEIIQHAIGADEYGRSKRYSDRNHFCAGVKDEPDCRELVALGLMKQHRTTEIFPYFNCSVTDAGISAMMRESPCHPKLTRSKLRYQRFLSHDSGLSFGEWLKYHGTEAQ